MINLIVQYFKIKYENPNKEQRQKEILDSFLVNLNLEFVEKIHWLYEDNEDLEYFKSKGINLENPKIKLYNLGSRLKYSDIFSYCNQYLSNKICVYLHADMVLSNDFINLELPENTIYTLTPHEKEKCKKNKKCGCTRSFKYQNQLLGCTFDGYVFKSPLKEDVILKCNHIVHIMGAETRTIAILKQNGYKILAPNSKLKAYHNHKIKIFANQHYKWIELDGTLRPLEYYQKIHAQQKNLPIEKRIIGGGIPFLLGTVEFI
jgi:hypothetical protein